MTGLQIRGPEPIDGPRPLPHNSAPCKHAPVAQLDRVPGYEPGGREFESLRARHFKGPSTCRRSFFLVLRPTEWCRIRPGRMRRSPPASGGSRGSAGNTTPRRTSLQGDFVRADRVCVEPGCTAPACWSRTRNHAADEIPLQRRPPPEAGASALDLQGADPCPLNLEKNLTFPGKVALTPSWWGHERQQASRWGARRPGFPGAFPTSSRPDRMGSGCTRAGAGL